MRKQISLKTVVAGVFPLIGSPEEGRNKKIRTLRTVGFQLTPQQAVDTATMLLNQAKAAHDGEKHTVVNILGRRKEGPSVLTIETALAPPVRRKRAKPSKENGASKDSANTKTATPNDGKSPGTPSKTTRKPPKPASARQPVAAKVGDSDTQAAA